MKPGQYIKFYLEVWEAEEMKFQLQKAKIDRICKDPLGFHETKATVTINGEGYGIPLSEIIDTYPADGEQLNLFE